MTRVAELVPGAISVQELAVSERDGIRLETRCGAAVLLLSTAGLIKAQVLQKTKTHDVEPQAGVDLFYALPVKKADGSPGTAIRVGRAASNDIVINDVSMSKLHAFIKVGAGGTFLLEDGGSKNGTFLDETAVPARGGGPPVPVRSRAALRFGSVKLQFLLVDDLRQMIASLGAT